MMRSAVMAAIAMAATPVFAAGDGLVGAPWYVETGAYAPVIVVILLLVVGVGFFLQRTIRLRRAVVLLVIAAAALQVWMASNYGLERALGALPVLALISTMLSPLFAFGWFIGARNTTTRAARVSAIRD